MCIGVVVDNGDVFAVMGRGQGIMTALKCG